MSSRPPHIFEQTGARWSDRTSGGVAEPDAVQRPLATQGRMWAAGAAATAWVVLVAVAVAVWIATG